jgi:hypothetical protein
VVRWPAAPRSAIGDDVDTKTQPAGLFHQISQQAQRQHVVGQGKVGAAHERRRVCAAVDLDHRHRFVVSGAHPVHRAAVTDVDRRADRCGVAALPAPAHARRQPGGQVVAVHPHQ